MKPAPRVVAIHAWGASLAVVAACASAREPARPAALAGSAAWLDGARAMLALADADRSGRLEASREGVARVVAESELRAAPEQPRLDAEGHAEAHVGVAAQRVVERRELGAGHALDLARLETCLGRVTAPDDEAVARAIEALDSEPASSAWDREIRKILVDAYDRDQTRMLDTTAEIDLLSCDVWRALDGATLSSRNHPLLVVYGFADGYLWLATELGFAAAMRDTAAEAASACGLASD